MRTRQGQETDADAKVVEARTVVNSVCAGAAVGVGGQERPHWLMTQGTY